MVSRSESTDRQHQIGRQARRQAGLATGWRATLLAVLFAVLGALVPASAATAQLPDLPEVPPVHLPPVHLPPVHLPPVPPVQLPPLAIPGPDLPAVGSPGSAGPTAPTPAGTATRAVPPAAPGSTPTPGTTSPVDRESGGPGGQPRLVPAASPPLSRLTQAALNTARSFWPVWSVMGAIAVFLLVYSWIDRRDPKMVSAPLTDELLEFS